MSEHAPTERHATRIVVWDTPAAIECGAPFAVKVGIKCAAECDVAARRVEIRAADGQFLASADTALAPWPGTALRCAELALRAPDTEGLHTWEASAPPVGGETRGQPAHAAAVAQFQVRTVRAPEFVLQVVAVDARSGEPVPGAKVVVHPYRTLTNALGVAEIKVPRGPYRLFVSGRDRFPFRSDGEVGSDTTVRAELHADRGPSDAELWA